MALPWAVCLVGCHALGRFRRVGRWLDAATSLPRCGQRWSDMRRVPLKRGLGSAWPVLVVGAAPMIWPGTHPSRSSGRQEWDLRPGRPQIRVHRLPVVQSASDGKSAEPLYHHFCRVSLVDIRESDPKRCASTPSRTSAKTAIIGTRISTTSPRSRSQPHASCRTSTQLHAASSASIVSTSSAIRL